MKILLVVAAGVIEAGLCGCQVREPDNQVLQPVQSVAVEREKPAQASSQLVAEPADAQVPANSDAGVVDAALRGPIDKSCTGEVGIAEAKKMVAQCTQMSPATRPPCNAANPCAMIREEIKRGCAMRDATARPTFCPSALP